VYKFTALGIITAFLRILGDDIWGNVWKEAMQCSVQWVKVTLKNGNNLLLWKEKWNLGPLDILLHDNTVTARNVYIQLCVKSLS
jgi:hypothetical protein